ncbi:MAG TPA: DUF362 domain-containing protein [Chitinivibrionales bacterium]|nr:DUF362 domain-containing protein [Chitinivibrionales bacterium]
MVLRSRHLTAAACIAVGAVAGGIVISIPHSPTFAATKADAPIGNAKGANPGRVVWVHDSTVSNWKGLGDGHWWESNHTNQTVVDQMMSRTLRELSGKTDDGSAWDTLFRYYNYVHGRGNAGYVTGEKIAVKINLTFCNYLPAFCCVDSMTYSLNKKLDYMNTSPQVVRALLRQLINVVGVHQADISVGDPTAYYPNEYYDSCHAEFPDVHYVDHAGKFGRTKVEYSTAPVYWSCRPAGVKQDYVAQHYLEATYVINLANMKSHMGGGITLCAKNHYGSLIRLPTDSGYYDLHQSLAFMTPQMGSYRALVDIMGHAHLGGKTVVYLVDGLYEGNHHNDTVPHTWPVAPFNGGWTSSLFASQDPVAIESVLFDLFQLDPDPYRYPKIAGAEDYLVEAAQADNPPSGTFYDPNHATGTQRLQSLGVFEHWNNPIDRKYSRNLGTGNGIELVFIDGVSTKIQRSAGPDFAGRSDYSLRVVPGTFMVDFSIPKSEPVTLAVLDARGRAVATVFEGMTAAGSHRVDLSSAKVGHKVLPAGTYLAVLYRKEGRSTRVASSCSAEFFGK